MIQKFMLCWEGNQDALIYGRNLFLTRVFFTGVKIAGFNDAYPTCICSVLP